MALGWYGWRNDLGIPTPEFGISETISDLLGKSRNTQGGSTLTNESTNQQNQQTGGGGGGGGGWGGGGGSNVITGGVSSVGNYAAPVISQPIQQQPIQQAPSGPSAQDLYRQQQEAAINQGWDAYINQLDEMLNTGLPGQKTAQEQIATESYNLGKQRLGSQRKSSQETLAKQQSKSLKDLTGNIRNLFQSGNVYLGALGAGDSSAANQYSYAVTKMGTKARGDIMGQANERLNRIDDIYNSELNTLDSERKTRIAQIADWFNSAQNQIRQAKGQAGLGRSQDIQALSTNIYNQALAQLNNVQTEMANRRSVLESWAASNAKNIQQLVQNMQQVQQLPAFQGLTGGMPRITSSGQLYAPPIGYSSTEEKKKGLFY